MATTPATLLFTAGDLAPQICQRERIDGRQRHRLGGAVGREQPPLRVDDPSQATVQIRGDRRAAGSSDGVIGAPPPARRGPGVLR